MNRALSFGFPLWVLALAFLPAVSSCGGGSGKGPLSQARAAGRVGPAPLPLFLLPFETEPRAGRPLSFALRAGTAPPGTPVDWEGIDLDYLFARQGGRQWILRGGEPVLFPDPGEGLLVLGTGPTEVPGAAGRVVYCAKTVVPIFSREDTKKSDPPVFPGRAKAGFPLEIVPLVDPGLLRPGDDCPLLVLFQGEGLPGVRIRAALECRGWSRPLEVETDREGTVRFRLEGPGAVLVTVQRIGDPGKGEPAAWAGSLYFRVKGGER